MHLLTRFEELPALIRIIARPRLLGAQTGPRDQNNNDEQLQNGTHGADAYGITAR